MIHCLKRRINTVEWNRYHAAGRSKNLCANLKWDYLFIPLLNKRCNAIVVSDSDEKSCRQRIQNEFTYTIMDAVNRFQEILMAAEEVYHDARKEKVDFIFGGTTPSREGYKMNYINTEDMQDIVAWRIISKVDRSFARVVEGVIAQEVSCTPSCEDSSYWTIKFSIRVVRRILQMLDNFKMQLKSLLAQLEEEEKYVRREIDARL